MHRGYVIRNVLLRNRKSNKLIDKIQYDKLDNAFLNADLQCAVDITVLGTSLLWKSCIEMFIHQRRPELKELLQIVLGYGWAQQWNSSVGIVHFCIWLKHL